MELLGQIQQRESPLLQLASYFTEADAPVPREKETEWLTVLGTCPTTQLGFITATAKGSWGLVSPVVRLSVSPTVANQTLLYSRYPLT